MNPSPKTPGRASTLPATIAFAEAFAPESDAAESARERAKQLGLECISSGAATTLTFLATAVGAKTVVEIGTGTGVSALALLAGMAADGVLTSIDGEAEHQLAAREVLAAGGVATRRVRLIAGQPLNVLPKLTDGAYDLVLIDGDPLEYVEYVAQAEKLLRSGGLLALHHALWHGLVADERNDDDEPLIIREALAAVSTNEAFTPALLPIGDGLLVAVKR
ncbi:MAG TPA: O-methyltransferase [Propionicimonas sp.]|nr:O-methyltransferase [Propionicimonas sp.]HQA76737.1 O-methyltransferase [Propionicimonas sp.]HQD96266.1 O-methyltransferase [Propionicimonas sp.]